MKSPFFQKEKKARYFIVAFFGFILLLLLLALAFFNHPSADDFNYSVVVRQYGFWGAQYYWYTQYCGRYFSTFLLSLNPLTVGSFMIYKLMSFVLIIISFSSFYLFVNKLFNKSKITEKLYITFFVFFSFILMMPSLTEGYYWFTGAYSYQTGNIMTLFLFALLISNNEKPSRWKFILSAIVVAFLAGTNEYSLLFLVLMLLLINIISFLRFKKVNYYYLTLFIISVIGFLVDYFAPGNTYRASFDPGKHQFLFSLKSSLIQAVDVLSHWWWIGILIIGAAFIIASGKVYEKSKSRFESIYLNPFLVLIIIFATVAAGFFPCYWSLGLYPPLRSINNIYFYFIIGSVYTGICSAIFVKNAGVKIPGLQYLQIVIPLLLIIYLFRYPNNINNAYHDLKDGVASGFNNELNERYNKMRTDECKICPVEKLKNKPKTLYFFDVADNSDYFMMESFAKYFHKDGVYLESK
jgi:hypothetical protein